MLSKYSREKILELIKKKGEEGWIEAIAKRLDKEISELYEILDNLVNIAIVSISADKLNVLYANRCAKELGIVVRTEGELGLSKLFREIFSNILSKCNGLKVGETYTEKIVPREDKIFLCNVKKLEDKYILGIVDFTNAMLEALEEQREKGINALSTLVAQLAHKIRNPLTGIRMSALVIEEILKNGNPENIEKAKGMVEMIRQETDKIIKSLNNFIIATKPQKVKEEYIYVNEVIKDVVKIFEAELKVKKIRLIMDLDEGLPGFFGDYEYLKDAITNILKNAIEALSLEKGKDKEIIIRTYLDKSGYIVIEIKDNGPGIPLTEQQKIFEPYYTTKKFGTGLGLTVTYKIVKDFGGDIKLESDVGKGATFRIFLPIQKLKEIPNYSSQVS